MKTKRILSVVLMLLALCSSVSAQKRLEVQLKDRRIMTFDAGDLNYIEFVEAPGEDELDGVWYLGWRISASSITNRKGLETVSFSSGRMKWLAGSTEDIYTLTYSEGGALPGSTISALKAGAASPVTYTIFNKEDTLLTLKRGSYRYYLYRSKEAAIGARSISGYYARQQCATGEEVWNAGIKGGDSHSSSSPMGKHIGNFAAATDADRAWLADPNNQPDQDWHELGDKVWMAKSITLYPMASSPVPADVNQHGIGDCCMCAVFASFAYIYPEWIKTLIEQDGNIFTVHMFDPKGNPIDVVVDNKLLCNPDGGVVQVTGKNNKYDWATIMEKALMKWETRFRCNKIGGIGTEHAAPPFTGNGDSYSFDWGDRMYNSEYPLLVDYALGTLGMIGVGGFHESGVMMGQLESVTGHAFTVMYADEGADYAFVMRNPWGNEPSGSTSNNRTDGKLKIPFDHSKLRLVDFRFVYPGAQMAQYKKENLGGYTPPKFVATYRDMNPSVEMLRMYNVKNYVPVYPKEDDAFEPDFERIK